MIWLRLLNKHLNRMNIVNLNLPQYRVCAVIVTYNRKELLVGAIDSLKSQTYPLDILVVNNGSTDGTFELLKDLPGISVINQDNVGGAGGFFTGIKYAVENEYDFSWVMDDDVIADPKALENLISKYTKLTSYGENIGFLCSNVTNIDGYVVNNPVIDDVKLNPTYHISWNRYLNEGMVAVKSATFVSVLIPTSVSSEVGLPIKEFFIWGDDTEYTTRISRKHDCFLVGESVVKHLRVGDKPIRLIDLTDKNRIKMQRLSVRNEIFLSRKGYYGTKHKIIFILWHFATFKRLLMKGEWYKIRIFLKGIKDGLFFNPKIQYINKKD